MRCQMKPQNRPRRKWNPVEQALIESGDLILDGGEVYCRVQKNPFEEAKKRRAEKRIAKGKKPKKKPKPSPWNFTGKIRKGSGKSKDGHHESSDDSYYDDSDMSDVEDPEKGKPNPNQGEVVMAKGYGGGSDSGGGGSSGPKPPGPAGPMRPPGPQPAGPVRPPGPQPAGPMRPPLPEQRDSAAESEMPVNAEDVRVSAQLVVDVMSPSGRSGGGSKSKKSRKNKKG